MDYGLKDGMGMEGKETKGKKTGSDCVKIQFRSDEGLNLSSGSGNGRRETDFKRFNKWNQKVLMIKWNSEDGLLETELVGVINLEESDQRISKRQQ